MQLERYDNHSKEAKDRLVMENTFPVFVFALRTLPASETLLTGETAWHCGSVSFDLFDFAQVLLESSW